MVNVGQFFSDAIYAVMVLLHKVQPLKMDSLEHLDIGKMVLAGNMHAASVNQIL